MTPFIILPVTANRRITASVGFISAPSMPDRFIAVKNKRGWDIPGGHLEPGESPLQALTRELLEETGCRLLPGSRMVAILESASRPDAGIAVFVGSCIIGSFTPTHEIAATAHLTTEALLAYYFGDKKLLGKLLALVAQQNI